MNKKLIPYVAAPVLAFTLLGAGLASAHGFGFGMGKQLTPDQIAQGQQEMFQEQATLLGISVDDVKNSWAKGESLTELAAAHGITKDQLKQKMKDARLQQMKTHLQALVDKGVITQAQADQRLQAMQNQTASGKMGMGFGRHMR